MPKTRPAPTPVSSGRSRPSRRLPACTAANAIAAITAAAGQCVTEPNDRPMGLADRDAESSATPRHSTAAPNISENRSLALAIGTAISSAKTRFVVSSGSTVDSDRLPIDQAARTWPPIMHPMPTSQRGWRSRSVMSFKRQEPRGRLALRGVLLEDEAGADQQRCQQRNRVVEAAVDVHGALLSVAVSNLRRLTTARSGDPEVTLPGAHCSRAQAAKRAGAAAAAVCLRFSYPRHPFPRAREGNVPPSQAFPAESLSMRERHYRSYNGRSGLTII